MYYITDTEPLTKRAPMQQYDVCFVSLSRSNGVDDANGRHYGNTFARLLACTYLRAGFYVSHAATDALVPSPQMLSAAIVGRTSK